MRLVGHGQHGELQAESISGCPKILFWAPRSKPALRRPPSKQPPSQKGWLFLVVALSNQGRWGEEGCLRRKTTGQCRDRGFLASVQPGTVASAKVPLTAWVQNKRSGPAGPVNPRVASRFAFWDGDEVVAAAPAATSACHVAQHSACSQQACAVARASIE